MMIKCFVKKVLGALMQAMAIFVCQLLFTIVAVYILLWLARTGAFIIVLVVCVAVIIVYIALDIARFLILAWRECRVCCEVEHDLRQNDRDEKVLWMGDRLFDLFG